MTSKSVDKLVNDTKQRSWAEGRAQGFADGRHYDAAYLALHNFATDFASTLSRGFQLTTEPVEVQQARVVEYCETYRGLAKQLYNQAEEIEKTYHPLNIILSVTKDLKVIENALREFDLTHKALCEYLVFDLGYKSNPDKRAK